MSHFYLSLHKWCNVMNVCMYCDLNDIDDELQLLLKCLCLNDFRQTFNPRYYYNIISMFKLIELLKSEHRNVLIKLCKFIKKFILTSR